MRHSTFFPVWAILAISAVPVTAAETAKEDPQAAAFFETKVRPLLVNRCVECHGAEKQKGSLRLDSREAALEGGDSGAVLVPAEPMKSLLMEVISHRSDIKMPPKSKLSDAEIADLTMWVKLGAPWPNSKPTAPTSAPAPEQTVITAEQKAFWAFQPIAHPALPAVKNEAWIQSPLDRFVLAELEARNFQPAPPADKRTLVRRVTFDLTGLPPTELEIDAFLADQQPGALGRLVDRLLESPRYGERWGRHWLDVARYADSNGLDENLAYANAYHYRDYVVRAFNQDKPFDEFVREQIAGDLLPESGQPDLQRDRLTATGFLCLGAKMLAEDDPVKMQMDIIDEQVDTVGRAFLGLTIGCARCHDHKYDPLPTADYYSLAGIFKSTKTMENFSVVARWQERPVATPEQLAAHKAQQAKIDSQKASIQTLVTQGSDALLAKARQHVGLYLLAATRQQQLAALLDQAQVRGNSPDVKSLPGALLIEAEDFQRGNVMKDRETYGQGIGVLVNAGPTPNFTEYDIQIPAAGDYQLEIRYAAEGTRPSKLFIDGQIRKPDATSKATGSWKPDTQTWFVEGIYRLTAGSHVVRLENPGPFPHIDKLLLTTASGPAGTIVELPASDYQPLAMITKQVTDTLQKSSTDPKSIWTAWHQYRKDQRLTIDDKTPENQVGRLLASTPPTSLVELAQRYQLLFDEAAAAWKTQQAVPASQALKALADTNLEAFRAVAFDPQGIFAVPADSEGSFPAEVVAALKVSRDQLKDLELALPKFTEVMAVSDQNAENLKIHLRGSHLTLGKETPRQFLRVIAGDDQSPIAKDRSGRLELANWLTHPEHPLTSRVIVNRVWQWHFGEGIVRSPDNFGRLGERPTHPQLLDWLAKRCIENGWSLKKLHRLIILSSTYQMSTNYNDAAAQVDPENRLLWRMNRRRLEVEEMRDALLSIGGALDDSMGGTQLTTGNRNYVTSTANVNPVVYQNNRRSIYLPVVRSALYELFQAFDFADPSVLNGRRDQTTVAPQALFMMNSALVLEQSQGLAKSLLMRTELDAGGKINALYVKAYGRPPVPVEVQRDLAYLERFRAAATGKVPEPEVELRAWISVCRAVLAANEFMFVE